MTDRGDSERVRSWEPMDAGDLPGLRLLAEAATRVEGDALARLQTVTADDLGELVVWAWVFDEDRTHVLMVDHHRFDVWVTPGGRADRGEDPLAAAARELLEETGATGVPVSTSAARIDWPCRPQSATPNAAVTFVGWRRTSNSPGTPLRRPNSSARSAPM